LERSPASARIRHSLTPIIFCALLPPSAHTITLLNSQLNTLCESRCQRLHTRSFNYYGVWLLGTLRAALGNKGHFFAWIHAICATIYSDQTA
jgi:hypothetical protein